MTPEESVLGACMLDESVIRFAVQHVMPSDFSTWQGEEIFTAICWLHAAKQPVDVVTVAARLREQGSKVQVVDLHRVVQGVPTAKNVEFYAAQVREEATRRKLRMVSMDLMQGAENPMLAPGETLAKTLTQLQAVRDDAPTTGAPTKSLGELMDVKDHYDWVIQGLFERGDRFIVTGPEGKGKTTLCRQITIYSAAGIHPFFLRPIEPVRVLVVDRENSELQWRRKSRRLYEQAAALGTGRVQDMRVHCMPRPMDLAKDKDLGMVHKLLDEEPADLLYIGPMNKLAPRALQTDDEAQPVLNALDSIRERGCVLLIEAHAGHGREQSLRPRGSSALLGWPEFGRGLRESVDNPDKWFLEDWRGDRDERDIPRELHRGGPAPWLPLDVQPALLDKFWHWREPVQLTGGF